jgi:hypothetical protein
MKYARHDLPTHPGEPYKFWCDVTLLAIDGVLDVEVSIFVDFGDCAKASELVRARMRPGAHEHGRFNGERRIVVVVTEEFKLSSGQASARHRYSYN